MTRRVLLKSGEGSPLRISVAGVDAAGAEFNDLVFDGNQNPLRRLQVGVTTVSNLESFNLAPVRYRAVAIGKTFPSGRFPVFCVYGRVTWVNATDPNTPPNPGDAFYRPRYSTPETSGNGQIGGGVSQSTFYAMNYTKNLNTTFVGTATINFLIFNNIY